MYLDLICTWGIELMKKEPLTLILWKCHLNYGLRLKMSLLRCWYFKNPKLFGLQKKYSEKSWNCMVLRKSPFLNPLRNCVRFSEIVLVGLLIKCPTMKFISRISNFTKFKQCFEPESFQWCPQISHHNLFWGVIKDWLTVLAMVYKGSEKTQLSQVSLTLVNKLAVQELLKWVSSGGLRGLYLRQGGGVWSNPSGRATGSHGGENVGDAPFSHSGTRHLQTWTKQRSHLF